MILQKTWDKYEVALLIECYENIKNGEDQKSALMQLSKDLRNMAILAGKNIDETYRNYNGMVWQYAYIILLPICLQITMALCNERRLKIF